MKNDEFATRSKQTPQRVTETELRAVLREIRMRDGDDQLIQLLEDLLDEEQIKPFEVVDRGVRVQSWRAAIQADPTTRALAIENEFESLLAELFMEGKMVFTLVQRTRPEIVWDIYGRAQESIYLPQ
jgi:hypothetical protein